MVQLWFTWLLARCAVATSVARLRRGPLRPGWSWGYEVVTDAQRRFARHAETLEPAAQRRLYGALRGPQPVLRCARVTRTTVGGVPCVEIAPARLTANAPVLLYLHGGAFLYGSERSHGELCARLAEAARVRLVLPLYRLAPEHPFPAASDDARAVWRGLREQGVPPSRLAIAGDSAGGNLVLLLALALRDAGGETPAAVVAISPWVDLAARGGTLAAHEPYDWGTQHGFERWARHYLAGRDARDPAVSPAHAKLHGLPPTLVLLGGAEMLFDQVSAFAAAATAAGSPLTLHVSPAKAHLWLTLAPLLPAFQADIARVGAFLRGHLPV